MSNRFDHLKKRAQKNRLSKEEFIEDAGDVTKKQQHQKPGTKHVLLSVAGKIDRERDGGKPILTYLKKDINRDLQKYCYGNKAVIINYLLRKGLDDLVQKGESVVHMEDS